MLKSVLFSVAVYILMSLRSCMPSSGFAESLLQEHSQLVMIDLYSCGQAIVLATTFWNHFHTWKSFQTFPSSKDSAKPCMSPCHGATRYDLRHLLCQAQLPGLLLARAVKWVQTRFLNGGT